MKLPSLLYIIANGVGWILYVTFLKQVSWVMCGEDYPVLDIKDNVFLMYTALPLLAFFLLVNLVWGGLAWCRVFPCRERGARASWIGVVTAWAAVYLVMYFLPVR